MLEAILSPPFKHPKLKPKTEGASSSRDGLSLSKPLSLDNAAFIHRATVHLPWGGEDRLTQQLPDRIVFSTVGPV